MGSIAVIICIYIWVLADSCASMHADNEPTITTTVMADSELGGMTVPRFGSLKRAHLSRNQTSGTSFYLRVGALGSRNLLNLVLAIKFWKSTGSHYTLSMLMCWCSAAILQSAYLCSECAAFGLGTLVFNGLEMAMHSMMEAPCLNDVVFVHPVLHGLFTFLQMHFLFVNSQVSQTTLPETDRVDVTSNCIPTLLGY